MKNIAKYALTVVMTLILTGAVTLLPGCDKREYHRHEEKTQKDVVVEEGPVVE